MRMSMSDRSGCLNIRPTMFRGSICSHSGGCRRCAWYWTISYCVVLGGAGHPRDFRPLLDADGRRAGAAAVHGQVTV